MVAYTWWTLIPNLGGIKYATFVFIVLKYATFVFIVLVVPYHVCGPLLCLWSLIMSVVRYFQCYKRLCTL